MREYVVKITDEGKVYINGKKCYCSLPMDLEDEQTDADKRALLSLANEMGYEATYLFQEMADRLEGMLDEIEIAYFKAWVEDHSDPEFFDMSPCCFDEWIDVECEEEDDW